MLFADLVDLPIEVFGGYTPAIVPTVLPPGASPACQDVYFPRGGVQTRGGLRNAYPLGSPIPANASINGLKSYLTATLAQRLLVWDSLGNFYKETPQGTLNLVAARPYQNLSYRSTTLFSREYQAFYNSTGGFDIPRQFDDTNWDRVSQEGPGVSPQVQNFLPAAATVQGAGAGTPINLAASPNGAVTTGLTSVYVPPYPPYWAGGYINYYSTATYTTVAVHGLSVGQRVTIAGVTNTFFNIVNATIIAVPTTTTFVISLVTQTFQASGSGNETPQQPSIVRTNGVATATTAAAHGFSAGWYVQIAGFSAIAIGGGITAISQVNGTATCTTTSAHGLVPGAVALISGTTNFNSPVSGWTVVSTPTPNTFTFVYLLNSAAEATGTVSTPINGTFQISSINSPTSFSYTQLGPNISAGGSGTATIVGNVSGGYHQVSVCFITRQGFITKPAPPMSVDANGSQLLLLTQIPTGPPNVIARLILVTPVILPPATQGTFYSLTSNFLINDNVTTSATIDFIDAVLIVSFQAQYLFTQQVLGECAFPGSYNFRTVWLGERNQQPNLYGVGFDGGFTQLSGGNYAPNGWTPDPALYTGGGSALKNALTVDYGDAFIIVGDGVTVTRGKITQAAALDYLGVPIVASAISYSVRARIASANALAAGTLHINLQSTIGGFTTPGLAVTAAQANASNGAYAEFTAQLTAALSGVVPSDLVLQIYADGTPTNGGVFLVDSVEVYPTNTPFNYSTARFSHAFNPESFDSVTGQVQVRPGDGQQLRAGFPLRSNFYLCKDHYSGYVADDGINEPSGWAFNEVSAAVGICGPNAVDWTEEWAVSCERSGVYIWYGSDPVKINTEMMYDASNSGKISWQSINWQYASTIWVRIDQVNKMVLIGAPTNGAQSPNVVFMLDYQWLSGAEDIASSEMVVFSAFTGKILAHGRGRRWVPWNITANSMCFAERADSTQQPFFGNGVANGKIYQQYSSTLQSSDDGVAINSYWSSHFLPSHVEEQIVRMTSLRKLLGAITFRATGVGNLNLSVTTTLRTTQLRSYALSLQPAGDGRRPLNLHGERFSLQVGTSTLNSWFQLEQLIPFLKKDAAIPVRGVA